MIRTFYITLFFLLPVVARAGTVLPLLDSANAAYQEKKFSKAAKLYEKLITEGNSSPEIFYNLGNAYYKQKRIGLSILNYERAKKLAPNDKDIGYNLEFVRQKVKDQPGEPGAVSDTAWQNFLAPLSERHWSLLAGGLMLLAFVSFAAYVWNKRPARKRFFFFSGIALLAFTAFAYFCAKQQYRYTWNRREAIVIPASIKVHEQPAPKSESFSTLHEGSKVLVLETKNDWAKILFGTGMQGWIKQAEIAEI